MLASLAVFGTHNGALWADGPVALGRRLTRLVPEDIHDRGPIIGGGGRFVLAAATRIDNRNDIIDAAGIAPERARTMCDSAILMAAFERWDVECFDRITGSFAAAILDRERQRLILARDYLGAAPLNFHRGKDFFAFASMCKGLHTLPDVPYAPNEERVAETLVLLPEEGSETFFKGIERVQPGCYVIVTPQGITSTRYWDPNPAFLNYKNPDDYVEGLRHHLDVATRAALRGSENMVAAHLSAGFDSGSVASTAARLMAPTGGKVVAFTSVPREGYDGKWPRERLGDEGPQAAKTAALYPNIEHVFFRPGDRTPFDRLDQAFFLFERPLTNLCNSIWGFGINDEVRARGLKVLLTGQMGNMSISYAGVEYLGELVNRGHWQKWFGQARALRRKGSMRWGGILAASFGPWLPGPVWHALMTYRNGSSPRATDYSAIHPDRFAELDMPGLARARNLDLEYRPRNDSVETRKWVVRRIDMGSMFLGTLGGWGIDMRDPTCDKRLFEYTLAVPLEQYLHDGQVRSLGKRALADRLPQEVLNFRQKGIQAVDWHESLEKGRTQLREEIARLEANPAAARAIDLKRLKTLEENWPQGDWNRDDVMVAYRLAMLRGISNGHFLRKASGGNM